MTLFKMPNNASDAGPQYIIDLARARNSYSLTRSSADTVRKVGVTKKKRIAGGDVFSDIGNWVNGAVNTVDQGLKESKILSKSAGAVGGFLGSLIEPGGGTVAGTIAGEAIGNILKNRGYGPLPVQSGGALINNISLLNKSSVRQPKIMRPYYTRSG